MPGLNLNDDRARMRFLAREGRMPNYRDQDALETIIRELEEKAVDWTGSAEELSDTVSRSGPVASAFRCEGGKGWFRTDDRVHFVTAQASYRKVHGWRRIQGRKITLRGECYACGQSVVLIDNPWSESPLYIQPVNIREWP